MKIRNEIKSLIKQIKEEAKKAKDIDMRILVHKCVDARLI